MKILDDEMTSKPRDVTWLRTAGSCSFLGDTEYPWWAGHLLLVHGTQPLFTCFLQMLTAAGWCLQVAGSL